MTRAIYAVSRDLDWHEAVVRATENELSRYRTLLYPVAIICRWPCSIDQRSGYRAIGEKVGILCYIRQRKCKLQTEDIFSV